MGLDLYHFKALKNKPDKLHEPDELHPFNENYILSEELEFFDNDINHFKDYIQSIEIKKIVNSLVFVKNGEQIKCSVDSGDVVVYNQYDFVDDYVNRFKDQYRLSDTVVDKWKLENCLVVDLVRNETATGFYYEGVGHQRKGMNSLFYQQYCHGKIYCFTKKSDFDFAFSCVDYYWDSDTAKEVEERKALFKNFFIDNYEPNRSWMWVDY